VEHATSIFRVEKYAKQETKNEAGGCMQIKQHFPPKQLFTFNKLHGIICQLTELFIITAVRTSDLVLCLAYSSTLNMVGGHSALNADQYMASHPKRQ
jgi:hypothetical protein